ncbi:hypothetical protein HanLR1_Chr12g0433941 [Helianthus annuus]|nr:hypothetical protein HanHA89_Chr12g0456501 [Helianthus annuus]KAJ0673889.1 hypothetical protein HanLR1_Chr12g0433941 [Helianthus annuus]
MISVGWFVSPKWNDGLNFISQQILIWTDESWAFYGFLWASNIGREIVSINKSVWALRVLLGLKNLQWKNELIGNAIWVIMKWAMKSFVGQDWSQIVTWG